MTKEFTYLDFGRPRWIWVESKRGEERPLRPETLPPVPGRVELEILWSRERSRSHLRRGEHRPR